MDNGVTHFTENALKNNQLQGVPVVVLLNEKSSSSLQQTVTGATPKESNQSNSTVLQAVQTLVKPFLQSGQYSTVEIKCINSMTGEGMDQVLSRVIEVLKVSARNVDEENFV